LSRPFPQPEREFPLNGLSVQTLKLSQDGDLEVVFDLPCRQTTAQYHTQLRGLRTLNVNDDAELKEASKRLFSIVRRRVMEPDPERLKVHCDRCATSACCRNYNVLVTEADVERLAAALGMSSSAFREKYTDPAVDWSGDYERQLASNQDDRGEEKCVFLQRAPNGQFRCSVYHDRPQICRDFDMDACDDFVPMKEVTVLRVENNAADCTSSLRSCS